MARGLLLITIIAIFLVISPVVAFKKGEKGKSKKIADMRAQGPKIAEPENTKVDVTYRPENCDQKSRVGDVLTMHYTGLLQATGQVFDSSQNRGPLSFQLGAGRVIKGWEQGLVGMCVGERRRLTVPPHAAYGEQGYPPVIPPSSTLVFETELLGINVEESQV